MCIIVHSKNGNLPDYSRMKVAFDNNPHGFGIMQADGGEIYVHRGVADSFDDIWEELELVEGKPWVMHLRWVTRGTKGTRQCHPFKIADKRASGSDIYMMHNGTFFFLDDAVKKFKGSKSDTEVFSMHMSEMLRQYSDAKTVLFSHSVQSKMRSKIGNHNRIVFMTDDGSVRIFNREAGVEDSDFWFSNAYSFENGYRTKKTVSNKLNYLLKPKNKKNKNKKHVRRVPKKGKHIRRVPLTMEPNNHSHACA